MRQRYRYTLHSLMLKRPLVGHARQDDAEVFLARCLAGRDGGVNDGINVRYNNSDQFSRWRNKSLQIVEDFHTIFV
jgi:hypothetical protein